MSLNLWSKEALLDVLRKERVTDDKWGCKSRVETWERKLNIDYHVKASLSRSALTASLDHPTPEKRGSEQ